MFNKKAETGIGTLILFIAMLIVASITANVLMQTATSLQNQALKTGKEAQVAVSTFAQIVSITATSGTDNNLEDFRYELKLGPGSDPIRFDTALFEMSLSNTSVELIYTNNSCVHSEASGYSTNATYQNGTFAVRYLVEGTNHKEGYLQRGDIAELCFRAPYEIGEDEDVQFRFTPKVGFGATTEIVTPSVIINYRERLYP